MKTPIRDWIEGLEPADRERMLEASLDDWVLLGALAVAHGPVGTEQDAAELRAVFLDALVERLRGRPGSDDVRRALWAALEVAAGRTLLWALDARDEKADP